MHNIFNDRFYSLREKPWHGLGYVSDTERGAVEAFSINPYDVRLEALVTESGITLPDRAIFRDPVPDDPISRYFGIVGPDYTLTTPHQVCQIWDDVVQRPVETWGSLGQGETFFITTKLPERDVLGDPIEPYFLVVIPLHGNRSNELRLTPIRVVCQNTMIAATQATTSLYLVRHDSKVLTRLRDWMKDIAGRAEENLDLAFELFGALAAQPVTEQMAKAALVDIFPDPKLPARTAPDAEMKSRFERYEYNLGYQQQQRDLAFELFAGAMTGADTESVKGTAYGFYNAVVELADYQGAGRSTRNDLARQRDALFGYRADVKVKALQVSQSMIGADTGAPKTAKKSRTAKSSTK